MDSERFVRDLAAALPEAFAGVDLGEEYYTDWGEPEQRWLAYTALECGAKLTEREVADARMWLEGTR